ncbi:sensor histidine kinase [Serinicoccus hydrothermalis]|nr:ATP-binding protein [Serinicoccus hydrothermalis]
MVREAREQVAGAWRRARAVPWLLDAALVGALLLFVLVTGAGLAGPGYVLVSLVQIVPLLWRRSHPLTAALAVAGGCLLQVVLLDRPVPANVAVLLAVYSAAGFGSRRTSRIVLGVGLVGAVLAGLDWAASIYDGLGYFLAVASVQTGFMACFVGVAWALGDVMRRRREVVSRLQAQNRALARDQAQRERLAAQDERATIAREMHDVVAHSLAVVVVQADGGLYAARQALARGTDLDADRSRAALEQAATTLETLAQTARASLADTRRLVGVLRDPGSDPDYAPLQGLAHLEELVQRVRASGVDVAAHVRGEVGDLSADVDLAAYRVVQEALTNAMKHAGPDASVDVDVLRTPGVLMVRVTDDGLGAAEQPLDGEGNGLPGMRERVEVLGGTVHAGPRRRRGWEVVATLPLAAAPATATPTTATEDRPGAAVAPGGGHTPGDGR